MAYHKSRKGIALLMAMIFLAILSAWAVSIYSISGANLQLAENQRRADSTRACAESGLEVIRFRLAQVSMPGTTAAPDKFNNLVTFLQNYLTANYDEPNLITILPVTLDSTAGQSFSAKISTDDPLDAETIQADVTGTYGTITRTIRVNYNFGPKPIPIFEYGLATKGSLVLSGSVELGTVAFDSDIYIESENNDNTLTMTGPSQIAGDVYITNDDPNVDIGNSSSIGGETGQAAIDNHVFPGTAQTEFPVPDPTYFEHYVQNTYDPNNVLTEYENVRIPAGTDPTFSDDVILRGIVFIETPNKVKFEGNTTITGIIVGDGDVNDNSETNRIDFLGTVDSRPVSELPDTFGEIKNETGTFIMAPGFGVSFGGNFTTLNGLIAANGVNFFGNAGGMIDGSIINYSDTTMTLSGSTDLIFKHSGTDEIPAGFDFEIILKYDPASYLEIVL